MERISIIPPDDIRIYNFIRRYDRYVRLRNIEMFSKIHKIDQKDMRNAINKLKREGKIGFHKSFGWFIKGELD